MGDERPDGWTSTLNFHICYARVWTMRGSRPDGWSRIGNFHISCTHVWTNTDRRLDGDIWITILALRRRASRRDTTSSGRSNNLSFIGTWKESETGRVPRGVRTCFWDVRTDASWIEPSRHSGGSGRKCTSSRRMMLGLIGVRTVWHVVWTDGTVVRWVSGWLTGNRNLRSAKSYERALNSKIPVYNIFSHTSDFVQNTEWGQNTNKLPIFQFWDKKTLDRFGNTFLVQTKITPPFCHKRTKGKTE